MEKPDSLILNPWLELHGAYRDAVFQFLFARVKFVLYFAMQSAYCYFLLASNCVLNCCCFKYAKGRIEGYLPHIIVEITLLLKSLLVKGYSH